MVENYYIALSFKIVRLIDWNDLVSAVKKTQYSFFKDHLEILFDFNILHLKTLLRLVLKDLGFDFDLSWMTWASFNNLRHASNNLLW